MDLKKKILAVDDSAIIRKIIRGTIESLRYDLLEASDGMEALDILEKNSSDIKMILLDWNMPGMNGIDFLKAVKSHKFYKHIPIIMITTESEKESIIKAIQAGVSNYLLKPFKAEELTKKIMDSFGKGEF